MDDGYRHTEIELTPLLYTYQFELVPAEIESSLVRQLISELKQLADPAHLPGTGQAECSRADDASRERLPSALVSSSRGDSIPKCRNLFPETPTCSFWQPLYGADKPTNT